MPLYAYIQIPGIENSESTDEAYGKKWIPIIKMDFKNSPVSGDYDDEASETAEPASVSSFSGSHSESDDEGGSPEMPAFPRREPRVMSGGELTVDKMIDATSPKLQLKCLECQQYASDKYIEGPVELHICRQTVSDKGDTASREIYMGYILENCLITSVEISASESDKLNESITLSFEKIHSCIRLDGMTWDSKGWDFITERPASPALTPTPPK